MKLGQLASGRRRLTAFWGAAAVHLQLAGIAAFAAAHACYLAVFLSKPGQRSWRVAAAYGALWAALIALLSRGLGDHRVPVAAYALLLTATAIASRWHNPRSGLGGTLFLISDALIALRLSGRDFPLRGPLVMSAYATGQYLLTSGAVANHQSPAPNRESRRRSGGLRVGGSRVDR